MCGEVKSKNQVSQKKLIIIESLTINAIVFEIINGLLGNKHKHWLDSGSQSKSLTDLLVVFL